MLVAFRLHGTDKNDKGKAENCLRVEHGRNAFEKYYIDYDRIWMAHWSTKHFPDLYSTLMYLEASNLARKIGQGSNLIVECNA